MERGLCGIFIGTCVGAAPVTSPGSASPRASPPVDAVSPRALSPGLCPQGDVPSTNRPYSTLLGPWGIGAGCAQLPQVVHGALQHPLPRGARWVPRFASLSPTSLFPKGVPKPGGSFYCSVQSPSPAEPSFLGDRQCLAGVTYGVAFGVSKFIHAQKGVKQPGALVPSLSLRAGAWTGHGPVLPGGTCLLQPEQRHCPQEQRVPKRSLPGDRDGDREGEVSCLWSCQLGTFHV